MKRLEARCLNGPGIAHGFFGREGGVSQGIYASLNCGPGSKDDPAAVAENRRRVADALAPDVHLVSLSQVHSPIVHALPAWGKEDGRRLEGDGMVTATPGLGLGILTADCAPVLFADPKAGVIGAAHAGWKGAFTGVLENTVAAMESLGASRERIVAVLGPSIGPDNYEVGPEFVARFVEADAGNHRYFRPSKTAGHSMFDLNRYTVDRLLKAGVTAEGLGRCTYAEEDLFYSYRRTTHRKEADYGRQVSAIVLEKE